MFLNVNVGLLNGACARACPRAPYRILRAEFKCTTVVKRLPHPSRVNKGRDSHHPWEEKEVEVQTNESDGICTRRSLSAAEPNSIITMKLAPAYN